VGILDDAIREHLELKRRRGATDEEVARQEAEALGPARRQPAGDLGPEADAEPLAGDEVLPPPALSTVGEDAPPPPSPESIEPMEPLEADPGDRLPPHGDVEPREFEEEPVAFEEPPAPALAEPSAAALDEPRVVDEPLHSEPSAEDPIAPPPEPEPEPDPDFPATEVMATDDAASVAEPADPELSESPPVVDEDATRVSIDDATRVRPTRPLPPLDDDSLPPEPAVPDPEPGPSTADDDVLEETPDFLQDTPDHDRLWFEQKPPRDFDFDD
jgi:hypothetical protein